MGLQKLVSKYKSYEGRELARRAEKKRKLAPYKALAEKKIGKVRAKKKFSGVGLTKAIGNPYSVKYPKAKKILKKVKKRKRKRRRQKVVVIYK